MKLFGSYTSPYVRHCRIALLDLGTACEFVDTDYQGSAVGSPTQRVPFLRVNEVTLTDSSSILMYLYQNAGRGFIDTPAQMELYALANTSLDTTINLFLLERDGLTSTNSAYLLRQADRIKSSLAQLEHCELTAALPLSIAETRLVCFLDWALYRNRISLDMHPRLQQFLELANSWSIFADTAPPQ